MLTKPVDRHTVLFISLCSVRKSGGVRWGRLAMYGLTTTGLALGGTLAYANYDPGFKDKVNSYVPGFASLADFSADKWVALMDSVNPKQSPNVGLKGEKDKVKMGPIKVKREATAPEDAEPVAVQPQRKEKEKLVVTQDKTVPTVPEKQESSFKETVTTEVSRKEQQQHGGGEGSVPSPPLELQTADTSERVAESKKPSPEDPKKLAVEEPKKPVEGGTKNVNEPEEREPGLEVRASDQPRESVEEKEVRTSYPGFFHFLEAFL